MSKERVTIRDIETAAEWLDIYEHDGSDGYNEAEGCHRVAAWLRREADRRAAANAFESGVRRISKQHPHASKRIIRKRLQESLKQPTSD